MAKIPGDWPYQIHVVGFLAPVENKKELFSFLSNKLLTDEQFPDDKDVYRLQRIKSTILPTVHQ
jgi:hypothetical protein